MQKSNLNTQERSFETSFTRRAFSLLRDDGLLAFAAFSFFICAVLAFCSTYKRLNVEFGRFNAERFAFLFWNIGVLFSFFFLHYAGKALAVKDKLLCVGSLILLCGVFFLLFALFYNADFDQSLITDKLILLSCVMMSLLLTVKPSQEQYGSDSATLFPISFLIKMTEAGGIFIGSLLVMFFGYNAIQVFADVLRFPDLVRKIWRFVPFFVFFTFCPLYTLIRLTDSRFSSWSKAFLEELLTVVFIPIFVLMVVPDYWSFFSKIFLHKGHLQISQVGWGGLFFFLTMAFLNIPATDQNTGFTKVLKSFKKMVPYISLPLIILSLAALIQRLLSCFALSSEDFLLFSFLCCDLVLCLLYIGKVSGQGIFLGLAVSFFVMLFLPSYIDLYWKAEQTFIEILQKHQISDMSLFNKKEKSLAQILTEQELTSFKRALFVLINHGTSKDSCKSSVIQMIADICQQQKCKSLEKSSCAASVGRAEPSDLKVLNAQCYKQVLNSFGIKETSDYKLVKARLYPILD